MKITNEDLLYLVEKINGARKKESGPENIILDYNDLKEKYTKTEIEFMLQEKLWLEEQALDYSTASVDPGKGEYLYHIGITDYFDKYRANLIKENYLVKEKINKGVLPLTLPPNTRWENITITFLNEHDVAIDVKGKRYKRDYKDMGFLDSRKTRPNKNWNLLKLLASKKGPFTWEHAEADPIYRKRKQLLSNELRYFFQIDEDPFYPYREVKGYEIKMKLIPLD